MSDADGTSGWASTTHDWAAAVDHAHLAAIRADPATHAPGGVRHLVLEVLAYAADEAVALGRRGRAVVTAHADGSVSVADDGRGTDTRRDSRGRTVRKPVMSSRDLRFYDLAHDEQLPDGRPRRGISVVAALSEWLVHTNRRAGAGWTQRYERGLPVTDLLPLHVDAGRATGTTVRFLPDPALERWEPPTADPSTLGHSDRLDVEVRRLS